MSHYAMLRCVMLVERDYNVDSISTGLNNELNSSV